MNKLQGLFITLFGVFIIFLCLSAALYAFTDGMYWSVKQGAMAGAFVIISGVLSSLGVYLGICVFAFGLRAALGGQP